jgi:hypothetical protein
MAKLKVKGSWPHRFEEPQQVTIADGLVVTVGMLRLSSLLRTLRAHGNHGSADDLERLHKQVGNKCSCGDLPDPAVGSLGTRVVFICPHCTGGELLKLWQDEGEN